MLRLIGWLCFASTLPLLQAQSCGFEASRDLGEPCTRSSDCEDDLICSAGVCNSRDAGVQDDASVDDASVDDASVDASVNDASVNDASVNDASVDGIE